MPDLSLDKLLNLANILGKFNQKHLTEKDPIHSVTLPDGERGQILIPPSCENGTTQRFRFANRPTAVFPLMIMSKRSG